MSLGLRVKMRLRELGMSQAELARRTNVPQTTINGLVNGSSRTTPHLIRIAQVLSVTPAYLTGETDNISSDIVDFSLDFMEQKFMEELRELSDKDRNVIEYILNSFLKNKKLKSS